MLTEESCEGIAVIQLYTRSHAPHLLEKVGSGMFTAQEHSYVIEHEFAHLFQSRDTLLRWYLSHNLRKIPALEFLLNRIRDGKYRRVVSLGAGYCVLEYFLQLILNDAAAVTATDFDSYVIARTSELFPQLRAQTFDFFYDDAGTLGPQDVAVFFGSAYVMDDSQMVALLSGLKKAGIKEIIDFHAGFMSWRHMLRNVVAKPKADGKLHGFGRNRFELQRLYAKAGWRVVKTASVPAYKFVAVLN